MAANASSVFDELDALGGEASKSKKSSQQSDADQALAELNALAGQYKPRPGLLQSTGQAFASAGDIATGIVPAAVGVPTYAVSRAIGKTPEEATRIAETAAAPFADPFGKAFDVRETEGYKGEAIRQLMDTIGQYAHRGAAFISEKTGLPVQDVENIMAQMGFIAPSVAKIPAVRAGARAATDVVKREAGYLYGGTVKPLVESIRRKPEATITERPSPVADLQAEFERRRAESVQGQPVTPTAPAAPAAPAAPTANVQGAFEAQRAAETPEQPVAAQATPTAPPKPTAPDSPFIESEYAEKGLPLPQQVDRAEKVRRVLGPDASVDLAAIEGKGKERADNYATSKTNTPLGNVLKEQLDAERKGLDEFANQQIKETGGTVGLDEATRYRRGNAIVEPLQNLESWYDKRIKEIYKQRDEAASQIPVETRRVMDVLNDESMTQLNTETMGLEKVARARMRKLGMIDKDGNVKPTNAETAERFRKFLNEQWDRKNAGLHRALKEAVDEDVIANLGADSPIYKDARALVTERKNTLDNPKGISAILEENGPGGINRKVAAEKVADTIANMDVDQATHIIQTLRSVPEELRPAADKALSELKAHFANKVAEANSKGANALTRYMNDNRLIMSRLFNEKEMARFRDLHDVAHILKVDTGYPGAAVQTINLEKKFGTKFKEQLLQKGATAVAGGLTGMATGPINMALGGALATGAGTAIYELIGSKIAKSDLQRIAEMERGIVENQKRRFVKLGDLAKEGQQ